MPVSPDLLEILVCPETKQPVTLAPDDVIAKLNAEIEAGRGDAVTGAIAEGLLREDGQILYVVDDSIPVMLVEGSIQIDG